MATHAKVPLLPTLDYWAISSASKARSNSPGETVCAPAGSKLGLAGAIEDLLHRKVIRLSAKVVIKES